MALIPDANAAAAGVDCALCPGEESTSPSALALARDEAISEDGELRPGAGPAGEESESIETQAPRPQFLTGVLSLEGVDARSVGVLGLACTALWFYDLFLLAAGA